MHGDSPATTQSPAVSTAPTSVSSTAWSLRATAHQLMHVLKGRPDKTPLVGEVVHSVLCSAEKFAIARNAIHEAARAVLECIAARTEPDQVCHRDQIARLRRAIDRALSTDSVEDARIKAAINKLTALVETENMVRDAKTWADETSLKLDKAYRDNASPGARSVALAHAQTANNDWALRQGECKEAAARLIEAHLKEICALAKRKYDDQHTQLQGLMHEIDRAERVLFPNMQRLDVASSPLGSLGRFGSLDRQPTELL